MSTPTNAGRFTALAGVPEGTTVSVFETGTATLASLFTDATSGDPAPNPVISDSLGNLSFFAVPGSVDLSWVVGGADHTVTVTVQPDPANAWPG